MRQGRLLLNDRTEPLPGETARLLALSIALRLRGRHPARRLSAIPPTLTGDGRGGHPVHHHQKTDMPMIRNGLRTRPKGMKPTPAGAASPAIDAELVQTLATLLASSDLAELEIEKGDLRIKLVRHTAVSYAPQPQVAQPLCLLRLR